VTPGHISLESLVAHRGYAARYPENTRESLAAAVRIGARYVECDVQLSADGVPVLLHDATLDRTAGRPGSVFDLSAGELKRIEVNETGRLGVAFSGVHIPLLQEVATDIRQWPGVTCFVELKVESLCRFGVGFMVDQVLGVLAPVRDACVVISFSAEAVLEARRRSGCAIGWVVQHWSDESRRMAERIAPQYLFCDHVDIPPPPAPLWPGPWQWVVYEVDDVALAQALVRRGVPLLETMVIEGMAGAVAEVSAATSAVSTGDPA
jgi:glycerophosphoryl diester phosphodiesterase